MAISMNKLTSIQQAKELLRRVRTALSAINARDKSQLSESEVIFRLNAIEGMLIMAVNDIGRMVRVWEEDDLS